MRDRRLHDRGEDKHPSPCLHPFCCLFFSQHLYYLFNLLYVYLLLSVCPPFWILLSLPPLSTLHPYVCTTCEHYLFSLKISHRHPALCLIFSIAHSQFSPTLVSLTAFWISSLTLTTLTLTRSVPFLSLWKIVGPWMHHLQHTECSKLLSPDVWALID